MATSAKRLVVDVAGLLVLGSLALCAGGCQLIALPVVACGEEPTRKVVAEYPYLAGRKVCVLVWADAYTLFEYPDVQFQVAENLRVALSRYVRGISVVPNRQVVEYQSRQPDWERENPARIGERFGAERVVLVELTQYTTREPDAPHLYRGHMAANVKVYDPAYPDAEPTYKTAVEVAYPPDSIGQYGTSERDIRRAMMEAFAAEVAGRFYERREKVK